MLQVGRNLTDTLSDFLREKPYLLMDRDGSFNAAFRGLLERAGIRPVRLPAQSLNCNAHLERFHGSFKREATDRMIQPALEIGAANGKVRRRQRLGGMLNYYYRDVA